MDIEINGIKLKVNQLDITIADNSSEKIQDNFILLMKSLVEQDGAFCGRDPLEVERTGLNSQKFCFVSLKV